MSTVAVAFGPGGLGPRGPGPGFGPAPGGPGVLQGLAIDKVKDKVCLQRTTNTTQRCVSSCPTSKKGTINASAECLVKCVETFSNNIKRCI
ncbi:MAG: hypothetical protein HN790_06010 [Methylococcales bacterium]|nr:hypothetical protein [Methylococcales bacterium]